MKKLLKIIVFVTPLLGFGQIQSHDLRYSNETAYDYVFRHRNNPDKVKEIKWNEYNIILAFYETVGKVYDSENNPEEISKIDIAFYAQVSDFSYLEISLPSFGAAGGKAEIISIFQANADKDPEQELFILASFRQISGTMDGTRYYTLVFDNLPRDYREFTESFTALAISETFSGCDCKINGQPPTEAKFTTSAEIREELEKRGFKQ